jgi:hypothetical protein
MISDQIASDAVFCVVFMAGLGIALDRFDRSAVKVKQKCDTFSACKLSKLPKTQLFLLVRALEIVLAAIDGGICRCRAR